MRVKQLKEGFGDDARRIEADHEVQMMRSQLFRIARDAMQLYDHLGSINPDTDLPSWSQKKITLSEDYIRTVLEFMQADAEPTTMEPIDSYRDSYDDSMSQPDEIWLDTNETITAGSVATVSQPLGKRKKKFPKG